MSLDPKRVQARLSTMKAARATHDSHWQEVADYILPARAFNTRHAPGSKRRARIFNTGPVLAAEQLAGGLHGMLTSPALRWFALVPLPHLAGDLAVRAWFEAATDVLYSHFQSARSGFDVALHETYLDVAGFGSGVIFTADQGRAGPHHQAVPLVECYYTENARREVDTLYRSYELPLREVLRLWPATAPDTLRRQVEQHPDKPVPIVHAVEPAKRGDWDSCYVTGSDYLEHGRFAEFPYAVPRWTKRSGETYGTGPGMNALPDVAMLNKLEELNLRGLAKSVDPAVFMPHDGFLNAPNANPGAINYYDSAQMRRENPIFSLPPSRPDLAFQYIELLQDRIRNIFYTTWLNLPQQPNMTATEVLQRRDELLRLLGPMVARLTAELLAPLIERTFAIMGRNGMFPPAPPQLANQGWTVEYLSPLARAQRAADAETVMRLVAAAQPLVQADPAVLEALDTDEAFRFLANRLGSPASIVRSPEQLAARRQQRADAEAQQAQIAAAQGAAGAAKDGAGALATLAGIGGQQGGV